MTSPSEDTSPAEPRLAEVIPLHRDRQPTSNRPRSTAAPLQHIPDMINRTARPLRAELAQHISDLALRDRLSSEHQDHEVFDVFAGRLPELAGALTDLGRVDLAHSVLDYVALAFLTDLHVEVTTQPLKTDSAASLVATTVTLRRLLRAIPDPRPPLDAQVVSSALSLRQALTAAIEDGATAKDRDHAATLHRWLREILTIGR